MVVSSCSVLRLFGPLDEVSAKFDGQVADMVNHMFDNGLREEYKEILNDDSTKRPNNCHALAPVVIHKF